MISTVTTTITVATLTFGSTLGMMSTVLLILLLASKELVSADSRKVLVAFGRTLTIGILPLLISFTFIVSFKVLEVL